MVRAHSFPCVQPLLARLCADVLFLGSGPKGQKEQQRMASLFCEVGHEKVDEGVFGPLRLRLLTLHAKRAAKVTARQRRRAGFASSHLHTLSLSLSHSVRISPISM
jgi:hypothetical protein